MKKREARILQATAKQPLALTVEESGCLSELANLIASYDKGYFDVLHLTGHANLKNGVPLFLLETETGEPYEASAEEISKALQFRFPQLLFLSGCRTGEAPKAGDVPSMAHSLLQQGATVVLGWGRPVLDSNGIDAAAALYGNLAAGYELTQAVARTYQTLLEKKAGDWHLLRLYVRGTVPEALVTPVKTPGRKKAPLPSVATEFLDSAGKVKVPTRESFVGRRRQLQKCLQALKYSPENEVGVLIHGMGGLGKSSLAARLCDRLTNFERIVWVGEIDEASLVHRLANKLDDQFLRETLQSNDEELRFKLRRVFVELEEKSAKPLLLVLDDFEANLEPRGDTFVLKPEAVSVLSALVFAIQESKTQHRLILTCRYDFDFSLLQHFYKQPLDALQGADLEKKRSRLNSFKFNSGVDNELQVKALDLADGNPRLLEWLDKVLQSPENTDVDADAILQRLENSKVEFREKVLAETLLGMINQQMREVLQLGLVFDLPVPREAMIEIASHIPECVNYIDRAIALGLLERSFDHCLRVPRILFIDSEENLSFSPPILQHATQILHRLWYVNAEASTEEQRLEIHRLALAAQETDIAAEIATVLTNRWIARSRFREALQICKSTLDITQNYRILHNLARSEAELGEVEQAKQHYQEILNNILPEDEQLKATTIHNLAEIYVNQGNVTEAITLHQQSLELYEHIGDVQGQAASWLCLAMIYANQGNVTGAITLHQQSLELYEHIGDVQGQAASLHFLAMIYANQGNVIKAISLYHQSLELTERVGDVCRKAASLHNLAIVYADQGNVTQAIALHQQSLELIERIGDVKGQAATLHQLARIYAHQGNITEAITLNQQSLELYEHIGHVEGKAASLNSLATIHTKQKNFIEAIALYQQSLELYERIGNVEGKAANLNSLAVIYANQGNTTEAITLYQQSLELYEHIGDVERKEASLHNLAIIYASQGNVIEAIALCQQSLELEERLGNVEGKAASLAMLGKLLADETGDFSTALSYLEQSLEILQRLQSPDAQIVRGIIERIQRSANEEQSKSGENTPAPRRGVNVFQILILGAVMLLCIGGYLIVKPHGVTSPKSNPTLLPR